MPGGVLVLAPPLVGTSGGPALDVPFGSSAAVPGAGVTVGPVVVLPGGMTVMGGATGGCIGAPSMGSTVGGGGPPGVVLGGIMVASGELELLLVQDFLHQHWVVLL